MAENHTFEYGPVEIYTVEFPGDKPDPGVLHSLAALKSSGTVRLLDMVLASRSADGAVTVSELEAGDGAAAGLSLALPGLLGEEDIAEAAESLAGGAGIALVALELLWAAELSNNLAAAGGTVTDSVRIPAPLVNGFINEFGQSEA